MKWIASVATLLLIACLGCAERGTSRPRIESFESTMNPPVAPIVRVATANLWGVSVLGFDWADEIDLRFAEFAERLARNDLALDVVLIQEAWKDSARRTLLDHAGVIQNFPHRVDAVSLPGGSGLVLLSRFPIERVEFHRFEAQGSCLKFWEGDCLSGKGALAAQLRIGAERLWFASTHLIACYRSDEGSEAACDFDDPNGDTRWSQIVETRRFMERLTGDTTAIIGGDFNFTRTSRYYPAMTSRTIPTDPPGSESAGLSSHANQGWSETGERVPVASRIDYIWTRPGLAQRWQAAGDARVIFQEPVETPDGRRIPISDHPIVSVAYCLVAAEPDGASNACDRPTP